MTTTATETIQPSIAVDTRSNKRQRTDDNDNDNDNAESSNKIIEENSRYQSDDADIILISSDNLRFRVHSYVLMTASPVFRTMIALGDKRQDTSADLNPQEVALSDPILESSGIVSNFLDIIYGRRLKEELFAYIKLPSMVSLIMLARKYDAGQAIQLLEMAIRYWLQKGEFDSLDVFVMGCHLDEVALCADAIRASKSGDSWSSDYNTSPDFTPRLVIDPHPYTCGLADRSVLDLSAAPLQYLEMVPVHYMFALMRASLKTDDYEYDEDAFEEMAIEFERLMGTISESDTQTFDQVLWLFADAEDREEYSIINVNDQVRGIREEKR